MFIVWRAPRLFATFALRLIYSLDKTTNTNERYHHMKAADATRILLHRGKTTNKLRKQCMAARATVMRSNTPITADRTPGEPTEYYSSKPSEITAEERLAKRLSRATLEQLEKWFDRSGRRAAHCLRLAEQTKTPKLADMLKVKAGLHTSLRNGCVIEINRRMDKAKSRAA